MPASRAAGRRSTVEVSMISRAARSEGASEIARASSIPSMPGICPSRITTSNGSPARTAACIASSAAAPDAAAAQRTSRARRYASTIARLVSLSSTTSTCRALGSGSRERRGGRGGGGRPGGGAAAGGSAGGRLAERGREVERAADARLGVAADLAAHQLDELARDRQAEAGAAVAAGRRRVGLREGLEQV